MITFIMVYHSRVVITNEIGSYELVGMKKKKTFLLNEFLTHGNMVCLVREWLAWMDEDCEVWFEGWIDIGSSNGPRMKTMSPVYDEKEWIAYVGVVMKSEIRGIELVARMVARNDVGDKISRSLTLPETVDEQHVECGVVLTQPSQETQADTDPEAPSFVGSNETMLNEEPICGSVGVGDAAVDTGFISGVDPQPIAIGFVLDVDPSFVEPEFMPEYEAAFGDERAEDSADDRPIPELSKRDKALLQRALTEYAPEMPDCQNLSQAHRAVADGLRFDDNVLLINNDNVIIWKGIIFKTMKVMKIWLAEYEVFHHHPFMVKHSDENTRYILTCHRGCHCTVHARKGNDCSWRITSVVQPYTCLMNMDDMNHAKLLSGFIS
jgi:hypothetical protein